MNKVVVIDNYDSFTYNLLQQIEEILGETPKVIRNDAFELSDLEEFDRIVLSPGPGLPSEAGQLKAVIRNFQGRKPILGVCLGHQAIAEVFGGRLRNLEKVYHGIKTEVKVLDNKFVFAGLEDTIEVGRYHSWVVDQQDFPEDLMITCVDEKGEIMGLRHKELPIYGVQFHPESILTKVGHQIMSNFLTTTIK